MRLWGQSENNWHVGTLVGERLTLRGSSLTATRPRRYAGIGAMTEWKDIVAIVVNRFKPKPLDGSELGKG
jgi:hypothetical protein